MDEGGIRLKAPAAQKTARPRGRIVTFYSYKGGTGRSMALANVAWLLAMNGQRVLVIDWDLEAPGLHRYFHPFLEDKELLNTPGLLDFVEDLAAHSATSSEKEADDAVDLIDYIQPLEWPLNAGVDVRWDMRDEIGNQAALFKPRGRIDFLPAGRQGPAYSRKLAKFNWVDFYERLGGRRLLDLAKRQMQSIYDYVLIDSRTGVSDTSGICTAEMPDTLVICFTLNQQSITGASAVAASVAAVRNQPKAAGSGSGAPTPDPIRIFPVPTRVEITSERDKLRIGLELARQTFRPFLGIPPAQQGKYWGSIQMAYFPFYAFEEIPAVFGDSPDQLLSLSTSIKQLTAVITDNTISDYPPLDEDEEKAERIRREVTGWYLRRSTTSGADAAWLAQEIFESLPDDVHDATQNVLARLVQIGDGGALSIRSARIEDFGQREKLLAPFVQARLITISDTSGARTVTFTDPSVVDKWKTLRDWIERNRPFLILRQTLVTAIQSWRLADHDDSLLLRGNSLVEAQYWADSRPRDLSDDEHQFIDMSAFQQGDEPLPVRSAARSPRWLPRIFTRWDTALMVLAAIVVVGYEGGSYMQRIRVADQNRISSVLDGVRSTSDNDPLTAILLLQELDKLIPPDVLRSAAAQIGAKPFPAARLPAAEKNSFAEFSPDGKSIAVGSSQGVEIRNAATLKLLRTFSIAPIAKDSVVSASWSSVGIGGKRSDCLVTLNGTDRTVSVWDVTTGATLARFVVAAPKCPSGPEISSGPTGTTMSPDGSAIIVTYGGGVAIFGTDGQCLASYASPLLDSPAASAGSIPPPVFNVDGSYLFFSGRAVVGRLYVQRWVDSVKRGTYKMSFDEVPVDWKGPPLSVVRADCSGRWMLIHPKDYPYALLLDGTSGKADNVFISTMPTAFDCKGKLMGGSPGNPVLFSVTGDRLAVFPHLSLSGVVLDRLGTRLATVGDNGIEMWPLDRRPPPKTATFADLMSYFRQNVKACLTVDQRKKYLNEVTLVAEQNVSTCQAQLHLTSSP